MMKIFFMFFFMVFMPKSIIIMMCMFSLLLMMMILNLNNLMNYYLLFNQDLISISLMILSVLILILMKMSQFNFKYMNSLFMLFLVLNFTLMLSFSVNNMLMFYFFFEWSLIPIFMIIMGWGYQLERLKSSFYLLMYTLFASLPLMLIMIKLSNNFLNLSMNYFLMINNFYMNSSYMIMFYMSFMVKFPMFFFHQWLPKAHVEAPVGGSMILAGILLKLGGYGMIRMLFFFQLNNFVKFIMIFSLLGGSLLSIVCLMNSDMKVMIAYSSVVHMAFIIMNLFSKNFWSLNGGMMMMIAHGICSSGMFSCSNMMYERSHSRMIMMNKGFLNYIPYMSLFWFILCMANFSGPFTYNLISEILLIISLSLINWNFLFFVLLISFFSAAYSLILYSNLQQGNNNILIFYMNNINYRELTVLITHCFYLISLLLSSTII